MRSTGRLSPQKSEPSSIEEARRLYRQAREYKAEETRQRNRARETMEALRLMCDELGIPIEIVKAET